MKKFVPLFLTIAMTGTVFGQDGSRGSGKISGAIVDAANDQPVEFATVALNDPATGKPVDGTVADAKGKFAISKIASGNYDVVISFIGYDSKTIPVTIEDKKNTIDLGTIKIGVKAEILKEVTVEGQKTLIEERVDRTIYNAENDLTTRGGDATDVLRRVPMLSVDLDGNVSMRGNSNIRVLINNRPSTIAASSISDALKQIPAEEIKSVEVITSPSARYDAEGSAGIINIITKKNVLQGATLNINSGVGVRGSNLGLNGAYRQGKVGISLGGFGRAGYNIRGSFNNRQLTTSDEDIETLTTQNADTRSNNIFGRYTLGLDYDINKNNFINASVQYGVRNFNSFQDNLLGQTYRDGMLVATSLRDADMQNLSGTVDINFGFTHLYEKPQQEFSILALYSRNNRTNDFLNNILSESTGAVLSRFKNENLSINEEITLQADYQTPIGNTQLVEFGGKTIMRDVSSDYKYFTATGPDGEFTTSTDARLSNVFNYKQNIAAGYLSYTVSLPKDYSLKAGARYEHTTIEAFFQSEQNIEIPDYGVLVPSVNLSRKLKNGNTVKAAYNRRIQRPSIQFLNPNLQAANPLTPSIGNPSLDPEFTNNYELSYSTFIKGTTLNFSGFARNSNNAIQSVREVIGQDTVLTTYQNIGRENAYGMSIFANVNIGGKFSLNGGTDIFYAVLNNNVPDPLYNANNEGWVASYRLFGNYNLTKGWGLQFFGFYRGRQVQLQGTQGGFGIYSLGIRKDFNEKRGSIGFGAENFFTTEFKIRTELVSPVIQQSSVMGMRNMNFRVNFSYRLGKLGADNNMSRRRKKSISNDDMKEGGDGAMNDGGQMEGGNGGGQQRRGGITPPAGARPAAINPQAVKADPEAVVNAEGTWTYTVDSPQGGEGTLVINKDGETLTGTISNKRFNRESVLTQVTLKGNELSFSYVVEGFGGNQMTVQVTTVVEESTMSGTMAVGAFGSYPIHAKRTE